MSCFCRSWALPVTGTTRNFDYPESVMDKRWYPDRNVWPPISLDKRRLTGQRNDQMPLMKIKGKHHNILYIQFSVFYMVYTLKMLHSDQLMGNYGLKMIIIRKHLGMYYYVGVWKKLFELIYNQLGDCIRGVMFSIDINMPIKGNVREEKLLTFSCKWYKWISWYLSTVL